MHKQNLVKIYQIRSQDIDRKQNSEVVQGPAKALFLNKLTKIDM